MVHNEGEQSKLIKGKTGEKEQSIFYKNINDWSKKNNVSTFFFEVFDENWKGGEHPNEVEKHWGVYNSNRTPKHIFK
jgi:exo-beta-1,3-glucanase (GH17 family)